MQNTEALVRVAAECAEDLAADGVVYAEVRFAPELHVEAGHEPRGSGRGRARGLPRGHRRGRGERPADPDRRLLTAMRHAARSREIAEVAVRYRDVGVVGFDIAGAEGASRPPATSTRSSTSASRTRTSPSTPARRSGCRRSGRRSSGAAPTGSATACGSSTTSRSTRTARPLAGSRPTCATAHPAGDVPDVERPHRCRDVDADHPIGLLARLRFRVTSTPTTG